MNRSIIRLCLLGLLVACQQQPSVVTPAGEVTSSVFGMPKVMTLLPPEDGDVMVLALPDHRRSSRARIKVAANVAEGSDFRVAQVSGIPTSMTVGVRRGEEYFEETLPIDGTVVFFELLANLDDELIITVEILDEQGVHMGHGSVEGILLTASMDPISIPITLPGQAVEAPIGIAPVEVVIEEEHSDPITTPVMIIPGTGGDIAEEEGGEALSVDFATDFLSLPLVDATAFGENGFYMGEEETVPTGIQNSASLILANTLSESGDRRMLWMIDVRTDNVNHLSTEAPVYFRTATFNQYDGYVYVIGDGQGAAIRRFPLIEKFNFSTEKHDYSLGKFELLSEPTLVEGGLSSSIGEVVHMAPLSANELFLVAHEPVGFGQRGFQVYRYHILTGNVTRIYDYDPDKLAVVTIARDVPKFLQFRQDSTQMGSFEGFTSVGEKFLIGDRGVNIEMLGRAHVALNSDSTQYVLHIGDRVYRVDVSTERPIQEIKVDRPLKSMCWSGNEIVFLYPNGDIEMRDESLTRTRYVHFPLPGVDFADPCQVVN